MSGGIRKEKHFFAVRVCLRFEQRVEVAQMKNSLQVVVVQKKSPISAGNAVNAF